MRTPGADFELAAGFLFAEGIIAGFDDIVDIAHCLDAATDPGQRHNVVRVRLRSGVRPDLGRLERHFFASSSCGVCGKTGIDKLALRGCVAVPEGPFVSAEVLLSLPGQLRAHQQLFERTGGLHAAALFSADGELVAVREDVGRHNALDKLVGWALAESRLPLTSSIVLVSGRASFEIVQKSLAAGAPILAAVSAPSSLAVETAGAFGMTLIGFLSGDRLNVYTGHERLG
jgi:FdhD protein